ncbi:MAG: hypothetical protein IAI49_02455 [Candidatus Eremiobacteraeota bacterium]|nr:hypothetical protein [Candidatus Eremiobacteraeota bacterium]
MRDAVTLEARGISTAILVNDVFEPIAHATAALLDLPGDYVAKNIVWLPHPTSNLTATAAATLIDDRIDLIREALLGRADAARGNGNGNGNGAKHVDASSAALETARAVVEGLAASLRADGADLVLSNFEAGLLQGEVRIGELTCDDGSCIMPTDALERMVEAMVRPKIASLERVSLREIRLEP